jgi:quinohemoprotein ethanol dehydrogenase
MCILTVASVTKPVSNMQYAAIRKRHYSPMKAAKFAATVFFLSLMSAGLLAATARSPGDVTTRRLLETAAEPGEWLTSGRDWRQTYYSPMSNINRRNVGKLGFAWAYDIDAGSRFQATPMVVDGVMFTSGTYGDVYALDAAKGTLLWSFKPKIDAQRFVFGAHRGVAVWRGKVYVPSADGYLYALDAGTGAVVWNVDTLTDRSRPYWMTGAPYIAKDLVLVGNAGSEFGTRGYVTAYESQTGKQVWRFFVVPGDPKLGHEHPELAWAAKTWDPNSVWAGGVGGNVWDAMAYDPELNLLYVGTGNGAPWNRKLRSPAGGDNLFLASILAINPDTGRLVWHYQTVPAENWDWGATQKMILVDLKIGSRVRKVLLQAPKNGFFYVLDRVTGELISADPLVYVNWASHVDKKTGRPVETGKADYSQGPKLVFPMDRGGHNWHPMSYNPGTGLVYLSAVEAGAVYGTVPGKFTYQVGRPNFGVYYRFGAEWQDGKTFKCWPSLESLRAGEPDPRPRAFIRAWDPVKQAKVWEAQTADAAGVISTASGLVFQGDGDGHFRVFDARSGKTLHDIDLGGGMMAAPVTYIAGGEQYVAIMAGALPKEKKNVTGRIVALKLGGGQVPSPAVAPAAATSATPVPPPIPDSASPSEVALGNRLYEANCAWCHANVARAPDLAQMTPEDHKEFLDIVLGGSRADKGMGSFNSILQESEARAIHAHIVHLAWDRHRGSKKTRDWDWDPANMKQDESGCAETQPSLERK